MRKIIYLLSIFLAFSTFSSSQSGLPDTTFGVNGIVRTDVGQFDLLAAIAIQPDQKILAVGSSNFGGGADFYVARYLTDGSVDADFGEDGSVLIDLIGTDDRPHAIFIQKDGSILIAGQTRRNNGEDFSLVKLKSDGTPDPEFGDNGMVIHDLGSTYEFANAMAVQEDGKIVLAGKIESKTFSDFAVTRYLPNGEVDPDFGNNGIVVTSLQSEDEIKAVTIQPGGQIVVAGFSSVNAKGDFALVRYLEDGTIDDSFGDHGKVLTDLADNGGSDFINAMSVDPDGKIVVAGSANFDNLFIESDLGMVRYDPDGQPDPGFDNDGIYILDLGNNTQVQSIARQSDGKYLVAGKTDYVFGHNEMMLARILHDGGLDTSFGDQGISLIDLDGDSESATSMVVQNNSRVVIGGNNGTFTNLDFVLARFIADFTMDAFIGPEITCHGGSDGSLFVAVTEGGIPPYTYSLDGINFQSSSTFNGLSAGTYTVTVKDSQSPGVTGSIGPITIADTPEPPTVHYVIVENDLIITVDGPGIYFYSLNGVMGGSVFTDLPDGPYHFIVEDQNGCFVYENDFIIQFTAVKELDRSPVSVFPNPCKDFLMIGSEVKNATMSVSTLDITGQLMNNLIATTDAQGFLKLDVSNLTDGIYFIKIKTGGLETRRAFVVAR